MGKNLHISYDLYAPGQNYEKIADAIKELGNWAKVHKSFWYVNSTYSAEQACNHVWRAMDANDSLYVVDSTNNEAAWQNLSKEVSDFIKERWYA